MTRVTVARWYIGGLDTASPLLGLGVVCRCGPAGHLPTTTVLQFYYCEESFLRM